VAFTLLNHANSVRAICFRHANIWRDTGVSFNWGYVVMRKFVFGVVVLVVSVCANLASAQQSVWVQIEAQRSLSRAQDVARNYSARLQGVTGFVMRSGWYAIAIGPFSPTDAEEILQQLRVTRQVPGDSYVVDGSQFGRRFWPIGATVTAPLLVPQTAPDAEPEAEVVVQPLVVGEETVAQARQSERLLDREGRMQLQRALQWEGHYNSTIDGAIGRGTRRSMGDWQLAHGYEPTGILTTAQRRDLLGGYQDMLASLGMAPLIDNTAGIAIEIPTAMVKFDRYEPPFAHFEPKGTSGAKVLLISQTGDQATLRSLYDVMQTLEIVPLDGARKLGRREFTLVGENRDLYSHTYAKLVDGHVKGFTLIWTGQQDRQRDLVINTMKASFAAFEDAVLPDVYGDAGAVQSLDLVAGLVIRQPDSAASGFYVDSAGSILTTAQNVASCASVTINDDFGAQVVAVDEARGFALLRPDQRLAPNAVAQIATQAPRLNSEIIVAGYSYSGQLGAATLTFGTLSDLRGLDGDRDKNRLAVSTTASDSGGPVFAGSGAVLGLLLPAATASGRRLPDGVKFSSSTGAMAEFLTENGVDPQASTDAGSLDPEDLGAIAADMTVLVSCWN
jgi:hypothetical protein